MRPAGTNPASSAAAKRSSQTLRCSAGSACASAGATGVRYAIAAFSLLYIWSGIHMLWGARHRKLSGHTPAEA